nr:hypothetical protein [Microbacterium lemovicicum]
MTRDDRAVEASLMPSVLLTIAIVLATGINFVILVGFFIGHADSPDGDANWFNAASTTNLVGALVAAIAAALSGAFRRRRRVPYAALLVSVAVPTVAVVVASHVMARIGAGQP